MEKLIELLNEYEIWKWKNGLDIRQEYAEHNFKYNKYLYVKVISKKYEFIKRLVENDKIDFSKVKEKIWLEWELYDRMLYWYKEEDFLIMILSVEDEPIRFLCEILK